MKLHIENKELVRAFYQQVIGNRDTSLAQQIIAKDYIQHNPRIKTGLSGVLEAIEYLTQFPIEKPVEPPIKRIICDEEFVAVHLQVEFGGRKQVVMDIFRIEGGKLKEHWDAIQAFESNTKHGNSMMDGAVEIADPERTEDNKLQVKRFVDSVLIQQQWELLEAFVNPHLIQHHPSIAPGARGLKHFLLKSEEWKLEKCHRIVGEGNFVCVQSTGLIKGTKHVMYDLYRLEDGKIIEQWNVSQEIPEQMPHPNGMI